MVSSSYSNPAHGGAKKRSVKCNVAISKPPRHTLANLVDDLVEGSAVHKARCLAIVKRWNRKGVSVELLEHALRSEQDCIAFAFAKCLKCKRWRQRSLMDDQQICSNHWA